MQKFYNNTDEGDNIFNNKATTTQNNDFNSKFKNISLPHVKAKKATNKS